MGRKGRTSIPLLRFDAGAGVHVDLDRLVASRLMIQANSGGGKSWALRYLLEQTFGQVPHLVLDSEGEFMTLRESFPYVLAGKGGDVAVNPKIAKHTARRLVEVGASAVIDLYELKLHERREYVRLFLDELVGLPRKLWTPYLIVLDEAHKYAPEGGKSECRDAVVSLCSQGRKRGFCAILATQRLSKLAKDAAAETTHPEPGKIAAAPPPAPAEVASVLEQLQDLEGEAEEEERTLESQAKRIRELESKLRKAESAAPEPERIVEEVEVPAVDEELLAQLVDVHEELGTEIPRLTETMAGVGHALQDFNERSGHLIRELESLKNGKPAPSPTPPARRKSIPAASAGARTIKSDHMRSVQPVRDPSAREEISGPQARILDALAWLEVVGVPRATNNQVAPLAGQSPRSSGYEKNRSTLRTAGLIDYPQPGYLQLTDAGRRAAAVPDRPATPAELWDTICQNVISGPQCRMLRALVEVYPDSMTNEELAEASGQSSASSGYEKNRSTLRSLGYVDYPEPGRVVALPLLFLESQRGRSQAADDAT